MSGERDLVMGSVAASNTTDFQENNQSTEKENAEDKEYTLAGGKCSFHGVKYQLRLLMFFILKCLENKYSFKLATEMKDADKFDDVLLRTNKESPLGGYVYRLIQAKHKGDKSKTISTNALLSENLKGDFSLRAYLASYLKMRQIFTKSQDEIRDLIMCTNGKIKSKDTYGDITLEEAFEKTDYEDDIFPEKLWRFSAEGRRVTKDFLKTPRNGKTHDEADIDSYLNKLHFAFDQYGNDDLEEENKRLLQRICCISDPKLAYPVLEKEINDWMMSSKGSYFSEVDARKLLQSLKDMLGNLIFEYRDPVENFIGREEHLKEIDRAWKSELKNIVLISGLGGMGKSELARKYIHINSRKDCQKDSNFKRIVWITADSEQSLENSIHRLAERLHIDVYVYMQSPKLKKNTKTIMEEIYTYFVHETSVFVFDNVEKTDSYDETNHYIKNYFPVKSNNLLVIITSTWQWDWEDMFKISLKEIEQEDAEKFIKCNLHVKCTSSKDSITSLAEILQNYPLALKQALAYMKHKCSISYGETYSIENYLKDFNEEASQVLSCKVSSTTGPDYNKTTMTTWSLTFKTIEKIDKKAGKILILLSHFAPDNINSNNIFFYFEETDRDEVKNSLFLLENFSVIGSNEEKIHIHRLIQKVKLLQLKETGEYEETLRWILISVHKTDVEHQISVWDKLEGYKQLQFEFSHLPRHIMDSLIHSLRYEQAYINGKKSVRVLEEICQPTDINLLKATYAFGRAAFLNRHNEEALTLFEKFLKRVINELYECDTITQRAQNSKITRILSSIKQIAQNSKLTRFLSSITQRAQNSNEQTGARIEDGNSDTSCLKFGIQSCYLKSGNVIDALNLFIAVLKHEKFKKEKEILEKNILLALNTIIWIVRCHRNLGDKQKTLILNEKVYEKVKLILGENHEITLTTQYEIAMRHTELGYHAKALILLEEVCNKETEVLGENHEHTLSTKYSIAMCYYNLGDETESLFRLEKKSKEELGGKNKRTLGTKYEFAKIQSDLDLKKKALMLLEEVYDKQKAILGENHEDTLITKHQIALCNSDLGDKNKALKLLEEVYENMKDILGENHESSLETKYQMAMCHSDLGNKNKSLMLLEDVYEKTKDILGENQASSLGIKYQMAMRDSDLGDNKKALMILQEVYEKYKAILGENHMSSLGIIYHIAMCHSKLGDKNEALMLLEEAYEKMEDILGEYHEATLETKYEIAVCHSELGDKNKALIFLEEVYEKRSDILGENHEITFGTKYQIAMCNSDLGNKNKALMLLEEVYEKMKDILGENHKNRLVTEYQIAMCHSDLGNKNKALMLLEKVFEKIKDSLGDNHENTLETKYQIAMLHSHLGDNNKALMLLEEVYEKMKDILGENHASTLGTKYQIAMCYSDLGNKNEALMLLEEVYDVRKNILGENHESTLQTKYQIAMCHSELGDKNKALMQLEEVYEKTKDILGDNHENTIESKYQIAMLHSNLGDKNKYLMLLEEVYEKRKDILGENHESTFGTKYLIAMCHSDFGDNNKALMLFEEVYEKMKDILGENHECTLGTKYDIAVCLSDLGDITKALLLLEDVHEKIKNIFGEYHPKTLRILEVINDLKDDN